MRRYPLLAAVSGRTLYSGRTLSERALALVSRSYVDRGRAGNTRYISNNNAAFRRSVFLTHPLPTTVGPFATRLQSEAILRDKGQLLFEPGMRVLHNFTGWSMEGDIRRNTGYATIVIRLGDSLMPYAWLTRLGYSSIPFFVLGKILHTWSDCIRCRRYFAVPWHELGVALGTAVIAHAMEIPGMIRAFNGETITETAYR